MSAYPDYIWRMLNASKPDPAMSQDLYDAWLKSIGERPQPQEVIETKPGRCECGSTAAGSARHSTWCPAFEK